MSLSAASTPTFLVTSGTGKIGAAFVHAIASDARPARVRVATRDPAGPAARLLREMSPERVEPVAFDVGDAGSLRRALKGVTRLFLIAPFAPDMAAWHEAVMAAAKEAGALEHVVKVSVTGARSPAHDPPPGRIPLGHWQGEEVVRAAGFSCTFLRPTIFMQHFTTVPALYRAGEDRFFLPTGEARVAFLDCRDIAACGAALLWQSEPERRAWHDRAFELTGPRAHTAAEIASILSAVAGRAVTHVDGEAAFSVHAGEIGEADVVKAVYAEAAGGWFSATHDELAELTGRRATSFARFALDHAGWFRPR